MTVFRISNAFDQPPSPNLARGPLGALDKALSTLRGGGRFAMGARIASLTPTLHIEGLGILSLPVLAEQAKALIALAERAPYGRGDATLVDTSVRSSWQLAPSRLRFVDPIWPRKTLPRILARVKKELGVTADIEAQLYKLLVYEEGGFFLEHRDTEKVPGMFGTLVVALPSAHRGGELIVRHGDRTATLSLRSTALSRTSFGAFYTDCLHSLAPITEGYRVCLVYSLVSRTRLSAPPVDASNSDVTAALDRLAQADSPAKVVRVLSHHYTPAGLSFAALKGDDAAVASALEAAAHQSGFRIYLGMVSIHESGAAEEAIHLHRGRWQAKARKEGEGEEYEVIEVFESEVEVTDLRGPSGEAAPFESLPLRPDEVTPIGLLEREPFDTDHFSEATGNEGGSFERTYRRAALVLWPAARDLELLEQLPFQERLEALIPPVEAGHPKALAMLEDAVSTWWDHGSPRARARSTCVGLLVRAQRLDLLERFVDEVYLRPVDPSSASYWQKRVLLELEDLDGLALAARTLPFEPLMSRLIARFCGESRHVGIMARLVLAMAGHGGPSALAATHIVLEGLSRLERDKSADKVGSTLLATLVSAFELVDAEHGTHTAVALVEQATAMTRLFDLDAHLIPSALALQPRETPAYRLLEAMVVRRLEDRTRVAPTRPTTWAREAPKSCVCQHCKPVIAFMEDPSRQTFDVKAREDVRRHVESKLEGLDARCTTIRGSTPLTLRLEKTQRSFERRLERHLEDLATLSRFPSHGSKPEASA